MNGGGATLRRRDLAWIARILSVAGDGARYGVLDVGGRPRLVIPLDSRRAAAAGLRLYNAMTMKARVARGLLEFGLRLRIAQPFLERRAREFGIDREVGNGTSLRERLSGLLGADDLFITVACGLPDGQRVPVALVSDARGRVLAYAKIGWNGTTRRRVRHEAGVLAELGRVAALHDRIPRVLGMDEWLGQCVVAQAPAAPRARRGPGRLSNEHVRILAALFRRGGGTRTLESALLARLDRRVHRIGRSARWAAEGRLLGRALERIRARHGLLGVPVGWRHGDFAPWNTKRSRAGLFVFDWESADRTGTPGWDFFHFAIQAGGLLEGWNATTAMHRLSRGPEGELARRYLDSVELPRDLVHGLLEVYLVDTLSASLLRRTRGAKHDRQRALRTGLLARLEDGDRPLA